MNHFGSSINSISATISNREGITGEDIDWEWAPVTRKINHAHSPLPDFFCWKVSKVALVTIGDYDTEAKNEEEVKVILWTVILLLVQHGNVSGTAGDAETRRVLCSWCESTAELKLGCIWFLLETIHNRKLVNVEDPTSYSVKLLFLFFSGGILVLNPEEAVLCMCLNSAYKYVHWIQHFVIRKRCINLSQEG